MTHNQYRDFVNKVAESLLINMKDSSLVRHEDWLDDARDIISLLREQKVRNLEKACELIEAFYVEKESHDHFTDFETPAQEVAKCYLINEYL